MKSMVRAYALGGLTLVSEIPIPELPLAAASISPPNPVRICCAEVTDSILGASSGAVEIDPDCFASPSEYFLRIPGIASYFVSNGNLVLISTDPAALPLDVRAYLLGTIFVVLCQQRGLLPLHASAVSTKTGVASFVAQSGQGKSSLAAHLAQRGFPIVSDDICLMDTDQQPAMVLPTAPWLKLWRNSLESLGQQPEGLERVFSEDDKYRFPLEGGATAAPIDRLIFLESTDNPVPSLEEVTAIEAIPLIMNLTHHAYLLEATGQKQQSFLHSSRVASQARAYRLLRPWGLEHLEPTLDLLESFLRPHS
jgi:hypothetical protein